MERRAWPWPATKKRRKRVATRANSNHARSLAPPDWVNDVVMDVRALYGVPSKRLLILWRRGSGPYSSGHTKVTAGEIVITAGNCEFDQGDTVLHELAHWLCRPKTHHKQQFWITYWKLVRHFGLDERKCLARSVAYRTRSEMAYEKVLAQA
jgi:hypothetical protein